MRLVLIGPPGVGKGTQAAILSRRLGVPHVSSGDLFREHVARRTPLGREAGRYLDKGELVPDHVTGGMLRRRLEQPDTQRGFLLDGFPRTVPQARELAAILDADGAELNTVLEFTAPEEVLETRLLKRGRPDDTKEVIRYRQRVYEHRTAPLLDHYADILLTVEAVGPVDEIAGRALRGLSMAG
ncbi:adenylate kinase [Streptomyces sp. NBC_01235]|uniref:adenylate kinase n=1 Tax=Streptomyces sp. NBC_01235 TaxID=2903788 RepID=UPI002E1575D0|nr:adenylate kinase [Streptomyces sp. NBC_01235]